jgi:hypothetical protein
MNKADLIAEVTGKYIDKKGALPPYLLPYHY